MGIVIMVNHFIYLHGHTVVASLAKAYHKVVDVMGMVKDFLASTSGLHSLDR